jgi:IS605 OrfB family transposase
LREIDREIAATQKRGEDSGELQNDRRNLVQDALHRISNQIIDTASRHGAAIVFEDLENLSGPNEQMKERQYNRLIEYVRYKEKEKGLSYGDDDFLDVPPAGTSRTCPECGHREEQNRGGRDHPNLSRDEFRCQNCGYEAHADKNAARMIGIRGLWIINGGKDGTGCKTLTQYTKSLSQTRTSQTEAQRLS